jgi:Na+/glutamate symporter
MKHQNVLSTGNKVALFFLIVVILSFIQYVASLQMQEEMKIERFESCVDSLGGFTDSNCECCQDIIFGKNNNN